MSKTSAQQGAADRASVERATGLSIDYLCEGNLSGFKITNPNAPAKVLELSASQLQEKLERGEIRELFDVRTPHERSLACIDGAVLLDESAFQYIASLSRDTPLAFQCHHGIRSRSAAMHVLEMGFTETLWKKRQRLVASHQIEGRVPCMMRLMLSLLLTTLVACQGKPKEAKEDEPKAVPTAFERDLDRMCNVLSLSGALELQPGERAMHVGIWLAQNMESQEARELSAELTQLAPAPRIERMQVVLTKHGISQCPTVQTW